MAISEWDQRQLCQDGACVGVIGPDGTCKVCGRVAPDWGDERRRGLVAAAAEDGEGDATEGDGGGDEDEISPAAPAALGELAVWQRRRLCPDGACVGVIGPDGTCKVCGKAAVAGEDEEDDEEDDEDLDDGEGDEAAADEDEDGDEESLAASEDEEDDGDDGDDGDDDDDDAAASAGDGDLDDRKLCPDGACIGVIGADGRCKVCGKEAA
jgi:hypothetical protein